MILDSISNAHLYENITPNIKKAFEYIRKTNFNNLELGKHEIDGDNVFAILQEYETKDLADCKIEAHKKYIDVQFIISGSEQMGITLFNNQGVIKEYSDADDYALFSGDYSTFKINANEFAIFFPHDLHMPGIKLNKSEKLKKVVVKCLVTK